MNCKVCNLPLGDRRFLKGRHGDPVYYRDPKCLPDHVAAEIFCGPNHSYADHLRSTGQDLPAWLSLEQPQEAAP